MMSISQFVSGVSAGAQVRDKLYWMRRSASINTIARKLQQTGVDEWSALIDAAKGWRE